jgi:hypothetical protein
MSDNIFEQTFQVTGQARLEVGNIRGSVDVRTGEEGVVRVKATKQSATGDEKSTLIEIKQEDDGTVKAVTRYPDGGWSFLFGSQPCEVDYVVTAPRQCSLNLNGVSNTVFIEGFEGDMSVNSVSGDISLHDLKGRLRIRCVSGDADAERIAGNLEVETVSGNVHLKESCVGIVKGGTVSGDIRIRTELAEGPYNFKSVSGNVTLIAPANTRCTAELHSVSGDLTTAFPVSGSTRNPGNKTITIQGGGTAISMHSVSGNLSLISDEEIPSATFPERTNSTVDRKAVLEQVERGELTVEEALSRLH